MNIYTIGDLHLSAASNKPMGVFGAKWADHEKRIEEAWWQTVAEEDIVVIPGDISWAINFDEVVPDLQFLHRLPGRKILLKGNHEYWWSTGNKLEELKKTCQLHSISFLYNSHIYIEEKRICICGTRGWRCPDERGTDPFSLQDRKLYNRELLRLEMSLKGAASTGADLIAFMHYPPFNAHHEESGFTALFEKYRVGRCYYGHLHGPAHRLALNGKLAEDSCTDYRLVSADYLDFQPVLVM